MTYRLEFTARSKAQLGKLPKNAQVRLAERIAALADDPRPPGSRKIKGHSDCYRIRWGDYRIVYTIVDKDLVVLVVCAGHRREVYERLASMEPTIRQLRREELD